MSFDAVNEEIRNGGGSFLTLNKTSDPVVKGVVLDVKVRDMVYNDKKVLNKNEEPRREWLFTLEVDGTVKYWAAKERGQGAVRSAIKEALGDEGKLEKGGVLTIKVTKSSVQGKSQAEFDIKYAAPKVQTLSDDDAPPF